MPLPIWSLSGLLALLLGLYAANRIRGEEHGADQPQDPNTKEFISEDDDFWRWLLSGLGVAAITAYLVPKLVPTVNGLLQNLPLLTKFALGIWCLVFLKMIYKKYG